MNLWITHKLSQTSWKTLCKGSVCIIVGSFNLTEPPHLTSNSSKIFQIFIFFQNFFQIFPKCLSSRSQFFTNSSLCNKSPSFYTSPEPQELFCLLTQIFYIFSCTYNILVIIHRMIDHNDLKENHTISLCTDFNSQLLSLLQTFSKWHTSCKHLIEKLKLFTFFVFLHFTGILIHLLFFALLFPDFFCYFVNCIQQFLWRNWFQKVIGYTDLNRHLCIIKLIISTQNHDFRRRKYFFNLLTEFQSIHKRHLNIRDQDVWFLFKNHR